jgi:hypothetical protein
MNKRVTAGLIVFFGPINAHASDFAILGVALGCLVIAALTIALGIAATRASRNKGRSQAAPYLFIIFFLVLIGVGLVMDESGHMADSDFVGMILTVLIPGVLSFAIPIFVKQQQSLPEE